MFTTLAMDHIKLPFISYGTLRNWFHFSEPQFPHSKNEASNGIFSTCLLEQDGIMSVVE